MGATLEIGEALLPLRQPGGGFVPNDWVVPARSRTPMRVRSPGRRGSANRPTSVRRTRHARPWSKREEKSRKGKETPDARDSSPNHKGTGIAACAVTVVPRRVHTRRGER